MVSNVVICIYTDDKHLHSTAHTKDETYVFYTALMHSRHMSQYRHKTKFNTNDIGNVKL